MLEADTDSWGELRVDTTRILCPNLSLPKISLKKSTSSRKFLPSLRICPQWQRFWGSQERNRLEKCFSFLTWSTISPALLGKHQQELFHATFIAVNHLEMRNGKVASSARLGALLNKSFQTRCKITTTLHSKTKALTEKDIHPVAPRADITSPSVLQQTPNITIWQNSLF